MAVSGDLGIRRAPRLALVLNDEPCLFSNDFILQDSKTLVFRYVFMDFWGLMVMDSKPCLHYFALTSSSPQNLSFPGPSSEDHLINSSGPHDDLERTNR